LDNFPDNMRISNDVDEFDFDAIHRFLCNESYWAKGIGKNTVRKSFKNSLAYGGFIGATQVAFGRAVTDLATFGYLRDVVVLPAYRGKGYGKAIVEAMVTRLRDEGVSAMMLGTSDAHSLYEKQGFKRVGNSPKLMGWRKES
jgi:GNAT superfamily N-acetyltransferase